MARMLEISRLLRSIELDRNTLICSWCFCTCDLTTSDVDSQAKYEEVFRALGLRLKELRKGAGYSQEDMLTFGFSTRHWQQVESGRPVTFTTILRACDVFQIRPDELFKDLYAPRRARATVDFNVPLVRHVKKGRTASKY
jgi:hypothetical protein